MKQFFQYYRRLPLFGVSLFSVEVCGASACPSIQACHQLTAQQCFYKNSGYRKNNARLHLKSFLAICPKPSLIKSFLSFASTNRATISPLKFKRLTKFALKSLTAKSWRPDKNATPTWILGLKWITLAAGSVALCVLATAAYRFVSRVTPVAVASNDENSTWSKNVSSLQDTSHCIKQTVSDIRAIAETKPELAQIDNIKQILSQCGNIVTECGNIVTECVNITKRMESTATKIETSLATIKGIFENKPDETLLLLGNVKQIIDLHAPCNPPASAAQ